MDYVSWKLMSLHQETLFGEPLRSTFSRHREKRQSSWSFLPKICSPQLNHLEISVISGKCVAITSPTPATWVSYFNLDRPSKTSMQSSPDTISAQRRSKKRATRALFCQKRTNQSRRKWETRTALPIRYKTWSSSATESALTKNWFSTSGTITKLYFLKGCRKMIRSAEFSPTTQKIYTL